MGKAPQLRDALSRCAKWLLHAKVKKIPKQKCHQAVLLERNLRPRLAMGTVNRHLGFTVKILVPNFKTTKIHSKARKYYRK